MEDNKCGEGLSMSVIFKNLLSCSDEQSILEKTVHVYDPRELQTGWQSVSCNAKYVACSTVVTRTEQSRPASVKSDLSRKHKKVKEKETQENSCKNDKLKSIGVLSYGVPSWRTIIDPENYTYIQRAHPCLHFTAAGHKTSDVRLSFVDPAGLLDQHLGGFVQRQQNATNRKKYNPFYIPLNDLSPIVEEKSEFSPGTIVNTPKPRSLKPLAATSSKVDLQTSSIAVATRTLPAVILPNKSSAIDKKTGRIHQDILQSQKIKLAPFKQPYTPVSFVHPNKKQSQKLNWLPITTTSPHLPQSTSKSGTDKQTLLKPIVWSHDPIKNTTNHLNEEMGIKQ